MPRDRLEIGTHGKITVRQNANGTWTARTYYRDRTGKRRDLTAGGATKGRAQSKLQAKIKSYVPATDSGLGPATRFAVLADYWTSQAKPGHKKYVDYVVPKLKDYFGDLALSEMTPILISEYITEKAKPKKVGGREYDGPSSANEALDVLRKILDIAVTLSILPANPARVVKRLPKTKKPVKALTAEDLKKIRKNVRDYYAKNTAAYSSRHYFGDCIDLLIGTGCRIGEVLGLRWEDIDLDTGLCHVRGTQLNDGSYQAHTKTGEARDIHLPRWLVEVLQVRKENYGDGERVICTVEGKRVIYTTLMRLKHAFGEEYAGVKFHDFRRAVATYLDRQVGAEGAALQLGHEDTVVTRQSYIERKGVADFAGLLEGLG